MIIQSATLTSLLFLAACSVPPQAQSEIVTLPTVTVEDTPLKLELAKEIKVPALKPIPQSAKAPAKSTADTRCPPIEGETEQQRIIRKLDCLLERD